MYERHKVFGPPGSRTDSKVTPVLSQRHQHGSGGGWAGGHGATTGQALIRSMWGIVTGPGGMGIRLPSRRRERWRLHGRNNAGSDRRHRSLASGLQLDQKLLIRINYLTGVLLLSGCVRDNAQHKPCLKRVGKRYYFRQISLQWRR